MTTDRPFAGVMLMLAFCMLAPLGDSIAKVLGATVTLVVLLLVRFAVQAAILVPLVFFSGRNLRLPPGLLGWTLLRTVLHGIGIGLMFSALRYLPLADALAIAFAMPFIMLQFGHFFMGDHPVQATLVLVPLVLFWAPGRGDLAAMADTRIWAMLAALGSIGTLAHLCMTWSLRFAPASTLAPMQYLETPFGTAIGWLIFSDLPNGLAAIGICITVGAGLYIIARERRLSRQNQVAPAAV